MNELLTLTLLADPPKNTGPDFGKASPLGLLVVVVLLIGVFILVWSMNRHLKKLPESFDQESVDGEAVGAAAADQIVGAAATDDTAGTEPETRKPPRESGG